MPTATHKKIVLVGGGHTHVLVLRHWSKHKRDGLEILLVSPDERTPYSGMLPGLIAGHYEVDDLHINLRHLCNKVGVDFVEGALTSMDLASKTIHVDSCSEPIQFDVLSLDTGAAPDRSVPGAKEFTIPVKPVSTFFERWQDLKQDIVERRRSTKIAVVGGGAAGFEIALSARHAFSHFPVDVHWIIRSDLPMKGRSAKTQRRAMSAAARVGVSTHTNFDVVDVSSELLSSWDGRILEVDETLWCAGAIASIWPRLSGLDTDVKGFVSTNAFLQSTSHPFVFASGDIGTQVDTPSPKAGVFAVRQAPVLLENLIRYPNGQELRRYRPQHKFLTLMATGKKSAIADRGLFSVEGKWVWRWKDRIDRRFMGQFTD